MVKLCVKLLPIRLVYKKHLIKITLLAEVFLLPKEFFNIPIPAQMSMSIFLKASFLLRFPIKILRF